MDIVYKGDLVWRSVFAELYIWWKSPAQTGLFACENVEDLRILQFRGSFYILVLICIQK